jgi:ABC-type branched-subunit amino acid transport system permease subunit
MPKNLMKLTFRAGERKFKLSIIFQLLKKLINSLKLITTKTLEFLEELPRLVEFSSRILAPDRQMLLVALVILILIYKPKGICGKISPRHLVLN